MQYVEESVELYNQLGVSTKSLHALINIISRVTNIKFNENKDVPLKWYNSNIRHVKEIDERLYAFLLALRPLDWHSHSRSVSEKQSMVINRSKELKLLEPFFTDVEKKILKEWRIENNGKGLWD